MNLRDLARWILYVNGRKWAAYLRKEDAEEVAERRRHRGDKTEIRYAVEGFTDQ